VTAFHRLATAASGARSRTSTAEQRRPPAPPQCGGRQQENTCSAQPIPAHTLAPCRARRALRQDHPNQPACSSDMRARACGRYDSNRCHRQRQSSSAHRKLETCCCCCCCCCCTGTTPSSVLLLLLLLLNATGTRGVLRVLDGRMDGAGATSFTTYGL
jgi:hypothetical protein